MTDGRTYRFETKDQRDTWLEMALPEKLILSAERGTEISRVPLGATGFAISPDGEPAWIDSAGALRRDDDCAGPIVGRVTRMLFEPGRVWILSGRSLLCIDGQSLELLGESEAEGAVDVASDGADGAWLLTGSTIDHVDCNGGKGQRIQLEDEKTKRKVSADSIAGAGPVLAAFFKSANEVWLLEGQSKLVVPLEKILGDGFPLFAGERISASGSVFLIEGKLDGSPGLLLLDGGGNPSAWGMWEEGAPPLHVLPSRHDLVIVVQDSGELKLLLLKGAADAGGRLVLTPPLESDTRPGDWLRANVNAILPEGATLSLRWAATNNDWERDIAPQSAEGAKSTVAARVKKLQQRLSWSEQRTYVGRRSDEPVEPQDFAFPLHEATGQILWLELTMHHSQSTAVPQLCSIVVHHDEPSLMERLPAVYRTPDGDAGGVLRGLVSVLEATSQDLDQRIAKLADRLDPKRTEDRWLPALAKLLGLPFDDSLSRLQQRNLLRKAIAILEGRGTRGGIAALLGALFKGGHWRVTDRTEQLAPITLGGGPLGSALPAFLSGPSERVPKLNARLVLGRTGLCTANPCDELGVKRSPELLVEIAASAREQRLYGSAVRQMIEAMLPAGVRLRLRWRGAGSGMGETLAVLGEPRPLVLGDPMPVERVRLHGDRSPRLRNELRMGHRLQ